MLREQLKERLSVAKALIRAAEKKSKPEKEATDKAKGKAK